LQKGGLFLRFFKAEISYTDILKMKDFYMRKPFGKFLSLLLITVLLVQLLPVSVFAREGGSPKSLTLMS
jgi:hypothetical protein